jgi:non-heme chloroperoxidase
MHRNARIAFCLAVMNLTALLPAADKKPWKDANIQVGDIKIHYIEAGTGDLTILFIPGWTMNAEVWKEQILYFASRNYRVIAYDPRSQGLTTKTEEGNTYHQHAADLLAFLKAIKVERSQTTLVGWSAGVVTLLEYASSPQTSMPAHFVLVDGGPMMRKEADYPAGMTVQQARTMALSFEDDRAKATDQFVRGMFKSQQGELLYKELTDACLKTPVNTALALFFDMYTGDRRMALSRISAPTLVIAASSNRAAGEYIQSKVQGSKLELIDAGHALFLEKPQAFNQTLEAFLTAF